MLDADPIEHVFFAILLAARLADVLSTRLATPRLVLEANPIVRRLRWPFAWFTCALALVAYVHIGLAWMVAVASFLVAAQNLRGGWVARALGEERYFELVVMEAARSGRRALAYGWIATSSLLVALVGAGTLFFDGFGQGWAFYTGAGILGFAFANLLHTSLAWRRWFRLADRLAEKDGARA